MMEIFYLKYRDTLPILDVILKNPDDTVFDLTGSTAWKLHVRLSNGTVISRDMTKVGADTDGHLRYAWVAADWNAGGIVVGQHAMEYEVIGPGSARLTFPNDSEHRLSVRSDVGQG